MRKVTWMLRAPEENPQGGVTEPVHPVEPIKPVEPVEPIEPTETPEPDDVAGLRSAKIAETKKRQEAEKLASDNAAQAAYYKGLAEGRVSQTSTSTAVAPQIPQAPAPPVKPKPEQFGDDWQAYDAALDDYREKREDYLIAKTKFEVNQEIEQRETTGRQQQTRAQVIDSFKARLAKEAEKDPTLITIAETYHVPGPNYVAITPPMGDAILESEVGPKILRYLSNNKAEAVRLSSMTPASAIREIGKIEAAIINKPSSEPRRISQAPEPPTPVPASSSPSISLNPSQSDWIAERNKRDFGR